MSEPTSWSTMTNPTTKIYSIKYTANNSIM
jgi:hypothetical protein